MVDAINIDPRKLSTTEFAGLLAPVTDHGIGAMDRRAFARVIAPGRDSAIHWRITDGPSGDEVYETWITRTQGPSTPQCSTSNEPSHDPRVTLEMSGDQFLKLASGNSSPAMVFVMGKVQLDDDIGFAAQLSTIFDLPQA